MNISFENNTINKLSKWDVRFFELCDSIANWSEDESRKIGAIIVGSAHEIRSTGYNGLPRGVNAAVSTRHSRDNDEKYHWFEHAERNAIYNAARAGIAIENCSIYTSLYPCADCTRAIIQSGITTLNTFVPPEQDRKYQRSFEVSFEMFMEAKVKVNFFSRTDLKNSSS